MSSPEMAVRRCGELACQRDSHLRSLGPVRVVERRETGDGGIEVLLEDTVLFPEGGGQPSDEGVLRVREATEPDGADGASGSFRRVVAMRNDGGLAWHRLEAPPGPDAGIAAPGAGDLVDVEVDWERRRDNMEQHTAQHLITACALELFGRRTIGWSLGPSVSYLELEPVMAGEGAKKKKQTKMTDAELAALEARVAELVRLDTAVAPAWLESDSEGMAEIRDRMERRGAPPIPAGVDGPLRLVSIGSIDVCTCCGTHVKRTGELVAVSVLHAESSARSSKVFFVAGDRVRRTLGGLWAQQRALTAVVSVPPDEHVSRCGALLAAQRAGAKSVKQWQAQAASLEVENLLLRLGGRAGPDAGPPALAEALHSDDGDKQWVSTAASAFVDARERFGLPEQLMLLVTAGGDGEGFFALVGGTRLEELGAAVSRALEGRGGLSKAMYQGRATNLAKRPEALAMLRDAAAATTEERPS